MASFEAEIESAKNTHTQKRLKLHQLFYTQNGYKKEVIVKNNMILKSGKNGHIANAT